MENTHSYAVTGRWRTLRQGCHQTPNTGLLPPATSISDYTIGLEKLSAKGQYLLLLIIIHSFYIALFSALEQTHCAHWHVILNE